VSHTPGTNGAASGSTHPPALHVVDAEELRDTERPAPKTRGKRSDAGKPRQMPVWDVYRPDGVWVWKVETRSEEEATLLALETLPKAQTEHGLRIERRKKK